MKAYFISDIHIKSEDKNQGLKLVEFLKDLPQDTTHLILLGDIFDMWIGNHDYFTKKYSKIISEIKNLLSRGIEIHYFEGNHDLHLKNFWEKKIGVNIHTDEHFFNFDGLIVRAEHGDLMNEDDKAYLFLRKALRTFPINFLATQMPGKLVEVIGDRSSRISRIYTDRINQKYKEKVRKITHDYAKKVYNARPFDLLITGHTHVDDDYTFEMNEKNPRSVNLGSWMDRPKAFLITPTEQKFIEL